MASNGVAAAPAPAPPVNVAMTDDWLNPPPAVVVTGVVAGYLLGGAVLIETVFNLNGIGQYAVQSITTADYAPIQGFVLVAAVFTMMVYLIVDLLQFMIDPRVSARAS